MVAGTSLFPSSETGMLGKFWGRIKGAKYRFKLQDGTQGFFLGAVPGKGLILQLRGNHVVFRALRRNSRVMMWNSGFLLYWPGKVQSSF